MTEEITEPSDQIVEPCGCSHGCQEDPWSTHDPWIKPKSDRHFLRKAYGKGKCASNHQTTPTNTISSPTAVRLSESSLPTGSHPPSPIMKTSITPGSYDGISSDHSSAGIPGSRSDQWF